MLKNHLFNILIAMALILVIALTVREAYATSLTTSQSNAASQCDSLPSRYSLRTENLKETSTLLTYSEDGPTGMDGGLKELFNAYRTCSR